MPASPRCHDGAMEDTGLAVTRGVPAAASPSADHDRLRPGDPPEDDLDLLDEAPSGYDSDVSAVLADMLADER